MSEQVSEEAPRPFIAKDDTQRAHQRSDVDIDDQSIHHTLGKQPWQAAAGDHPHSSDEVITVIATNNLALPFPVNTPAYINSSVVTLKGGLYLVNFFVEIVAAGNAAGFIYLSIDSVLQTAGSRRWHTLGGTTDFWSGSILLKFTKGLHTIGYAANYEPAGNQGKSYYNNMYLSRLSP